jgi:iron complex outermembrane receptor protein
MLDMSVDDRFLANADQSSKLDFNEFSPTLGLVWTALPEIHLYANYAKSFETPTFTELANPARDTGFNVDLGGFNNVKAQTADSFEIGMKGIFVDGRLALDLAVFSADYNDFQILQFVETGPNLTDIQLRNAAEVETKGIEATLRWSATENLQIGIIASTLDATFKSFPNAAGVGVNFDNNELPNSPDFTGTVTVDYSIPLSSGAEIDIYGEYSHRTESFSLANNDPVFALIPSRDLMNARVTYKPNDAKWSLGLWARNLFDEEYVNLRARDFLGNEFLRRGAPRTFGAEVKLDF